MPAVASSGSVVFQGFRFDRRGGGLFRRGENGAEISVGLGSRALDILALLLERRGELVTKDEIIAAVWRGAVVEDSNLTVQIAVLRRVLDEGRAEGSCIQTVVGRGYRFIAEVHRLPAGNPSDSPVCGDNTGFAIAEPSHSMPVVHERGLTGGLPAAVVSDGEQGPDRISDPPVPSRIDTGLRRRRLRFAVRIAASSRRLASSALLIAAAVGVMLILGLGAWLLPTMKPAAVATSIPAPLAVPRLSIVVLPFANLSDDPDQQYFADGVTDDLTTDLSRIADSFVISRNTAFTYRNKPIDTKQIGRELGVRYVLEGSVRRSGQRVRVNAQLIDAATDAHLWADRFDGDTSDLFAMQNDIMTRIGMALSVELVAAEVARPTDHPDALDYILRGRAVMDKPKTRETYAEAISLFDHALTLDPRSAEAQRWLATFLSGRVLAEMTGTAAADVARAEGLAGQVLAAAPRSAGAHFTKGMVLEAQKRLDEAVPEYETAITLNRNFAAAYAHMGYINRSNGSPAEAIPPLEQAIRISPRDAELATWYEVIGRAHLMQGHIDEALVWAEKARAYNPERPSLRALLAAGYALNGESERGAAELAEARRLSSDDRYSSISRLKTIVSFRPKALALYEPTYLAGLRKAGMPEE
jgi:TolB-like protein/DNA-binding winged helix-turn-helix (wHTH) protein/Flp pilus assembly protein TadD